MPYFVLRRKTFILVENKKCVTVIIHTCCVVVILCILNPAESEADVSASVSFF